MHKLHTPDTTAAAANSCTFFFLNPSCSFWILFFFFKLSQNRLIWTWLDWLKRDSEASFPSSSFAKLSPRGLHLLSRSLGKLGMWCVMESFCSPPFAPWKAMCVSRSVSPTGFFTPVCDSCSMSHVLRLIPLCRIQRHNLFYSILPNSEAPQNKVCFWRESFYFRKKAAYFHYNLQVDWLGCTVITLFKFQVDTFTRNWFFLDFF